jgi:hypothetical protein
MEPTEFGDSAHQDARVVLRVLDDNLQPVITAGVVHSLHVAPHYLANALYVMQKIGGRFVEITCLQP